MNLETLYIQIEAETSKIKSQVATVNKQFEGMGNTLKKTFSSITKAAVAAFSVAAIIRYGKGIIDVVDNLKELNAQTGLSTDRIQELQYATSQTGGNFESVKRGIQTLNEQIAAGNPLFTQLGIDVSNTETAFNQVLNVLADMPESAAKATIGQQLLGRSFLELKPLLAEGSKGIEALSKMARDGGFVMSNELIAAIDNLGDSFSTLGNMLKASLYPILEAIVPIIQKIVNWLMMAAGFITGIIQGIFGTTKKAEGDAAKANTTATKTMVSNAAKVKRAYAGFDELNVISSETGAATGIDTTTTTPGIDTTGSNIINDSIKNSEELMKSFNDEVEKGRAIWDKYGKAVLIATGAVAGFWTAWTIGSNIGIISTALSSSFETLFTTLYVWFDDFFIWLSGLAGANGPIGTLATNIWNFFTTIGASIGKMTGLKIAIDGLAATMIGAVAVVLVIIAAIAALFQLFTESGTRGEKFRETMSGVWQSILDFGKVIMENLKPWLDIIGQTFVWLWEFGIKPLWNGFVNFINGVVRLLGELWITLSPIVNFILALLTNIFGFIMFLLIPAFNILFAAVSFIFGGLFGIIGGFFDLLADGLKYLRENWDTVWGAMSKGFKNFVNPIIDGINMLLSGLNKIKFDIPKWVPIIGGQKWGFSIPLIPKLADGGMLDAGSLFIAGEAGAELIGTHNNQTTVMPLQNSDFTAAMGQAVYGAMVNAMATQNSSTGSIVINVDGMALAKSVETNLNKLSTVQGGLKIAL